MLHCEIICHIRGFLWNYLADDHFSVHPVNVRFALMISTSAQTQYKVIQNLMVSRASGRLRIN